jgi:hypothetical protein
VVIVTETGTDDYRDELQEDVLSEKDDPDDTAVRHATVSDKYHSATFQSSQQSLPIFSFPSPNLIVCQISAEIPIQVHPCRVNPPRLYLEFLVYMIAC